ncbi:Uncharacterised protein [Vibrio cholerae]|nr:Uncharacterised protein [Vibrio cholerae]
MDRQYDIAHPSIPLPRFHLWSASSQRRAESESLAR